MANRKLSGSLYRVFIKFHDDLHIKKGIPQFSIKKATQWVDEVQLHADVNLQPLFSSLSQQKLTSLVERAHQTSPDYRPPNFLNYYTASFEEKKEAVKFLDLVQRSAAVAAAHLEIAPTYQPSQTEPEALNHRQRFSKPSPAGINLNYARKYKGGWGIQNVQFINIEQGWLIDHEDISFETLACSGFSNPAYAMHGLQIMSILKMRRTVEGQSGIAPQAKGFVVSPWRNDNCFDMADALLASIQHLCFGDILLIQAQAQHFFTKQKLPVETFDVNFELIRLASALGIVVIEPAGNGNTDLDLYSGFKSKKILNPLTENFKDSGAVLVAAASSACPHQRMPYSNYGNRINCYGWGENVVTATGHWGVNKRIEYGYTKNFSGTSAASAIIAGAAILLQSINETNLGFRLCPATIRNLLSNKACGTVSENGTRVDKIGVLPDLKRIIKSLNIPINKNSNQKKTQKLNVPAI